VLAIICLLRRDPRKRVAPGSKRQATRAQYGQLLRIPSFIYNTVAMTAWTFAIGGIAFWVPSYLHEYRGLKDLEQVNTIFGTIVVVAGFAATLCGGWLGDKLRERNGGSYFLVSGGAMFIAVPLFIAMLYVPFPFAWGLLAVSVFFLFFNMGPSNTALANVTPPSIRATAFALNIFCVHLLGDAFAPPLIGFIAGRTNFNTAFLLLGFAMLAAGVVWLRGARHLKSDTDVASATEDMAA
jgi:MFS family permease